jgi:hypothetical protein
MNKPIPHPREEAEGAALAATKAIAVSIHNIRYCLTAGAFPTIRTIVSG